MTGTEMCTNGTLGTLFGKVTNRHLYWLAVHSQQ